MSHSQQLTESRFVNRLAPAMWVLAGLFLISYGFFAFNAGTKVSPTLNPVANGAEQIGFVIEQANKGVPMADSPEAELLPAWINLIANIESSEYVHGDDSIMDTEQHFFAMGETKRQVLSAHMMLGLVIMAAGFFQFWPAFRRKHRKTHRVLGLIYVLAGFSSMAMSGYYLLNTDISRIYSQFIFYAGLWLMLTAVVVGLSVAGYAIIKRNIAVHLGWQAFAFGSFLTAPIQRLYWVGMAPISDGASFNEMNIVMNVSLFAQAFLGGYWLFYINRQSSPLRGNAIAAGLNGYCGKASSFTSYGAFALLWMLAALFYFVAPGFANNGFMQNQAALSVSQWHDQIFSNALPGLMLLALAVFLIAAARLISATPASLKSMRVEPKVLLAVGLIIVAIFLNWGWRLGMPSHLHSLAGVFYSSAGLFLLWFLVIAVKAMRCQQYGRMKEWLWFATLFAASPAVMYGLLWLVDVINLVPDAYRAQGHGYQLAAAAALFVPVLLGHVLAIYSAETKRYAVN